MARRRADAQQEQRHEDEDDDSDSDSDSQILPLDETKPIDFSLVYALHTFVATLEGQVCVLRGDSLVLLDDSNSYWWLVKCVKTDEIGYIPAENIETPYERLARLNRQINSRPIFVDQSLIDNPPPVSHDKSLFFDQRGVTIIYLNGERESGTPYCDQSAANFNGYQDMPMDLYDPNSFSTMVGSASNIGSASNDNPYGGASNRDSAGIGVFLKKGRKVSSLRDSLFSFGKKDATGSSSKASRRSNETMSSSTASLVGSSDGGDEENTGGRPLLNRPLSEHDLNEISKSGTLAVPEPIHVVRIFAGNVDLKATFKTVALKKDMLVTDLIQAALKKFRVPDAKPEEFYIGVLHMDSQERRIPESQVVLQLIESLRSKDSLPGVGQISDFTRTAHSRMQSTGQISSVRGVSDDNIFRLVLNKKLNLFDKNHHLMRVFMFDESDPSGTIRHYKTVGVNGDALVSDVIRVSVKKFKIVATNWKFSLCSFFMQQERRCEENELITDILAMGHGSSSDIDFILRREWSGAGAAPATGIQGKTASSTAEEIDNLLHRHVPSFVRDTPNERILSQNSLEEAGSTLHTSSAISPGSDTHLSSQSGSRVVSSATTPQSMRVSESPESFSASLPGSRVVSSGSIQGNLVSSSASATIRNARSSASPESSTSVLPRSNIPSTASATSRQSGRTSRSQVSFSSSSSPARGSQHSLGPNSPALRPNGNFTHDSVQMDSPIGPPVGVFHISGRNPNESLNSSLHSLTDSANGHLPQLLAGESMGTIESIEEEAPRDLEELRVDNVVIDATRNSMTVSPSEVSVYSQQDPHARISSGGSKESDLDVKSMRKREDVFAGSSLPPDQNKSGPTLKHNGDKIDGTREHGASVVGNQGQNMQLQSLEDGQRLESVNSVSSDDTESTSSRNNGSYNDSGLARLVASRPVRQGSYNDGGLGSLLANTHSRNNSSRVMIQKRARPKSETSATATTSTSATGVNLRDLFDGLEAEIDYLHAGQDMEASLAAATIVPVASTSATASGVFKGISDLERELDGIVASSIKIFSKSAEENLKK